MINCDHPQRPAAPTEEDLQYWAALSVDRKLFFLIMFGVKEWTVTIEAVRNWREVNGDGDLVEASEPVDLTGVLAPYTEIETEGSESIEIVMPDERWMEVFSEPFGTSNPWLKRYTQRYGNFPPDGGGFSVIISREAWGEGELPGERLIYIFGTQIFGLQFSEGPPFEFHSMKDDVATLVVGDYAIPIRTMVADDDAGPFWFTDVVIEVRATKFWPYGTQYTPARWDEESGGTLESPFDGDKEPPPGPS